MTDQKPPRIRGDDRETLTSLLQYQRESLVRKVAGLNDETARRSPVPSGTSLLWLVEHMAYAEETWILRRFAGSTNAAEAPELAGGALERAVAAYRAGWPRVDAVVAAAGDLDELSR